MGLLNKLTVSGSNLSYNDGTTPLTNILATKLSPLHYDSKASKAGWSVDGFQSPNFGYPARQNYARYNDGVTNPIPNPTQLDLNDPNADPNYKPIYTPSNSYKNKIAFLNQP
jgi:hypothetical protein